MARSSKPLKVAGLSVLALLILGFIAFKIYAASQTDALYEAVVRDVAGTRNPLNPPQFTVFFVGIKGQDPSPAFLQKFAGAGFSVRPFSRASSHSDATTDLQTGEKGGTIKLGRISWFSPTNPVVFSGNGYLYSMTKEAGAWRVENRMMMTGF